jgi:hypothetical protein
MRQTLCPLAIAPHAVICDADPAPALPPAWRSPSLHGSAPGTDAYSTEPRQGERGAFLESVTRCPLREE